MTATRTLPALGLALGLALGAAAGVALAGHGARIVVSAEPSGPYELTVWTSPSPARVGPLEVSVLVQQAGSRRLAPDARVLVTAEPVGRAGHREATEATRGEAANRLFHAATLRLPTAGEWRIGVAVRGPAGEGAVGFDVRAEASSGLGTPLLVLAATAGALALVARRSPAVRRVLHLGRKARPRPS